MEDKVKIILLIFLFVFAVEDIKMRSIPVYQIVLYLAIFAMYLCLGSESMKKNIALGLIPGVICLVMSIITREKIGLGDAAMIGIMGITIGGSDTLWVWWIASVLALAYCLILGCTYERKSKNESKNERTKIEGDINAGGISHNTIGINHNTDLDRRRNPAL